MLSPPLAGASPAEARVDAGTLRVQAITEIDDLELLRQPWHELLAFCPQATPFQSPEWLMPWLEHFGKGALWTLAVWRGERLVGLAPFLIVPRPEGRTLTFVGAPVTDYNGVLVAAGRPGEGAVEAIVTCMAEASGLWDVCDLEQLRPGEPLLEADFPSGFSSEVTRQDVCPYVTLPFSGETLTNGLPHDLGPRLHRCVRSLRRTGELLFVRGDQHTADDLLDALFRLHAARWNLRDAPGVLDGQAIQQFHRAVAAGMLTRGRLRLYGVQLCGRFEAVVYAFAHGRRIYSYLGGWNPVLARFSPGLVSVWQAMLAAIDEGKEEFDFLRGSEAYKYRLGARERWNRRRVIRPA